MRPYLVGGACHRLQQQLDQALSEGVLDLPPELSAHADRCPSCGPQVREVEALFRRLRTAPASFDLGPVPGVVDAVLQSIAADPSATAFRRNPEQEEAKRRKQVHLRWVLGQVAAMVAALAIAIGGLTYLALKVNHAVGGAKPSEVVERWVTPFKNWTHALFRAAR